MCYHINGAIVQELDRPTGHLKIPDADYLGINAFFHDPLSDAADCKLRHIAAQAMERQYADGTFALLNFIRNADLLIIGGTSLAVYPAAGLIDYYRGNKLVLINKSTTPMDGRADLVIQAGLGEVFEKIQL